MAQRLIGLSQVQENDCRAAMQRFIDRHEISDWEMSIKVEEPTARWFNVKIEMTPPPESGLRAWPMQEIAVGDASVDVAAEVDRLLELAFQNYFPERATQ